MAIQHAGNMHIQSGITMIIKFPEKRMRHKYTQSRNIVRLTIQFDRGIHENVILSDDMDNEKRLACGDSEKPR